MIFWFMDVYLYNFTHSFRNKFWYCSRKFGSWRNSTSCKIKMSSRISTMGYLASISIRTWLVDPIFVFDSFVCKNSELSNKYSEKYIPKPEIEGLGENVTEFTVFLVSFIGSWLLSLLIWQPLSYIIFVIIDFKFRDPSTFGKMHVSSKILK